MGGETNLYMYILYILYISILGGGRGGRMEGVGFRSHRGGV
jgi:hypothetical protein